MKIIKTLCLITTAAMLFACSSAESDWNKAQSANTAAAYQDFLTKYPNDPHAQQARDHLQQIQDEAAWSGAQKANTLEAYQQYLQQEPKGAHVAEAQTQVAALQQQAAQSAAVSNAASEVVSDVKSGLQDLVKKKIGGQSQEGDKK